MAVSIHNLIITNPQLRGGRPIISGTTIRVMDVAALMLYHGRTPNDIAVNYKITLAQVHAALAYYYANKTEIDADLQREDDIIREAKENRFGQS
ncbi:MAG: DUF433 domain-containing protein [Anaerolineae bacterium]|nr:DUF433 domain-containing protein [Anaerolineae bacterium]